MHLQENYMDVQTAKRAVEKNDVWALLYFGWNYTECLMDRLNNSLRASDEVLDWSEVVIWMDMSSKYHFVLFYYYDSNEMKLISYNHYSSSRMYYALVYS